MYWSDGEDFLQNTFHFPAFEDLPREGEFVKSYWKQNKSKGVSPACTWFFMGEITKDDVSQIGQLRNLVLVTDREGRKNIPIAFYPESGFMDYKLLKNNNTIFVANAQQHHFLDFTVGLRVENLSTVTIAPCSMEDMLYLSAVYHDMKDTMCWWCGASDVACQSVGGACCSGGGVSESSEEGLKKCSACKVARYCSRECQLIDWKDAHRRGCKAMPIFNKLTKINYTKFDTTALLGPAHFIPGLTDYKKS